MADFYIRSADGSDADDGTTWALAKATLAGAEAVPWVSGDRWFVSDAHAQTGAAAITIDLPATAPGVMVLCGDDVAEPPTTLTTTATVTTTGASAMTFTGYGYIYGLTFACGNGANAANLNMPAATASPIDIVFESCAFQLNGTGGTNVLSIGYSDNTSEDNCSVVFKNCSIKFSATNQFIALRTARGHISGLTLDSAGSTPTTLFGTTSATSGRHVIENSDLSGEAFTNLISCGAAAPTTVIFRNCKLPAAVTITTGTFLAGGVVVILDNCDSGDTNYRFAWHSYEGSAIAETTIVRTGGATDGTTTISWEMASSANTTFFRPLRSDMFQKRIAVWNETVGSAVTATVECITDNVTLTDKDAWIEVEFLGTTGFPKGSIDLDDRAVDILATAANQTTSTETWTTTGLATPVKQKLAATFTPQEKGWVMVTVCLARASTTVFVDPKITLS